MEAVKMVFASISLFLTLFLEGLSCRVYKTRDCVIMGQSKEISLNSM